MGRWDYRSARDFDKFSKPDDKSLDDWQKENNTNFDWRETAYKDHERGCTCPKCEHIQERKRTQKSFPITYKYCPDHFKAWHETKHEMYSRLNWLQRQVVKFMFWRGMVKIIELKHAQSDLCIWCRFGGGGRGIKTSPLRPDM